MTQAPKQNFPWLPPSLPPEPLRTTRFVTEPLHETHATLDFEALMSCRARLREELSWGEWPPENFTLDLNRADLRQHHDEFIRREAFAYTVLSSDRSRCLGCIYIEHCSEVHGAQFAFWVIDDAVEMEIDLVTTVLQWIHRVWSVQRVVMPFQQANPRGIALAESCSLTAWQSAEDGPLAERCCFLSDSGADVADRFRTLTGV